VKIAILDQSTMTDLQVRLPARLHLDGWLVHLLQKRVDVVKTDEAVDEVECAKLQGVLRHARLPIDELGVGVVTGSPTDDLLPGRAMLSFDGVSVEVDAHDLTRALKPFLRRLL
jgi:hypothetical protein